jgi:hypothetical protein
MQVDALATVQGQMALNLLRETRLRTRDFLLEYLLTLQE